MTPNSEATQAGQRVVSLSPQKERHIMNSLWDYCHFSDRGHRVIFFAATAPPFQRQSKGKIPFLLTFVVIKTKVPKAIVQLPLL